MLEWLKKNAEDARRKLQDEVSKFRNRDFMEAVVAGCAIVAAADGTISAQEKKKMIGFIENSDELKVFKTPEVIAVFNKAVANFDFDAEIGKAEALKMVGKIRTNVDAARLMVRVCCAIGAADGDFDTSERAAVKAICKELGLDPADFDL
jgi:tellurite resistance protein TerB